MKEFDPGDNAASIVSVTDRVRPLAIGMPVTSVHFLGGDAAFVGAEESVAIVIGEGEMSRIAVHSGGILCAASDGTRIVMGGDDGKLVAVDAKGEVTCSRPTQNGAGSTMSRCIRRRGGVVGRQDRLCPQRQGRDKSFELPSTVGGLAFAPKGLRLAVAHYNGRDLVVSQHGGDGRSSGMGGLASCRHLSPDNKFLVTAMHDRALHGWRLADHRHMRMSGYPGGSGRCPGARAAKRWRRRAPMP